MELAESGMIEVTNARITLRFMRATFVHLNGIGLAAPRKERSVFIDGPTAVHGQ